jgi:hypothetical protein
MIYGAHPSDSLTEGYGMTAHILGDIGDMCLLDNLLNQLVATVCVITSREVSIATWTDIVHAIKPKWALMENCGGSWTKCLIDIGRHVPKGPQQLIPEISPIEPLSNK